jgi:hypothetical protein
MSSSQIYFKKRYLLKNIFKINIKFLPIVQIFFNLSSWSSHVRIIYIQFNFKQKNIVERFDIWYEIVEEFF